MTLTVIKPLPQTLLTRNPATLSFLKKGIYSSAGSYADIKFELDWSTLGTGAVWKLQWGSQTVTINFVAAETNSPFDILEYASGTVDDYLFEYLIPGLNKIEALINDFIIEQIAYQGSAGFYIRFRARKKGTAYNIATASGTTITVDSTIAQNGTNATLLENYKLKLRILAEEQPDTGVLKLVKELEGKGYPDEVSNQMQIDFRDIPALMSRYAKHQLPFDPYKVYIWEELFSKFNIEYAEVYGGTPVTYKVEKLSPFPFTALPAGVALTHADYYEWLNSFQNEGILKFTSFHNKKKLVSKEQPEWLLVFANTTLSPYTHIRVSLRFSDNTIGNQLIAWQAAWNDINILLPVGFKQLNLEQFETGSKKIIGWEISILNNGGTRSEVRNYIVDPRYHREQKFILFFNSLYGIETVRLTGAVSSETQTTQETAEQLLADNTTVALGTMSMVNKAYANGFGANTGNIQKSEADYYISLMNAEHVYECGSIPPQVENKSVWAMEFKKLMVTSNKYSRHTTNQFLWSYDFDFKYAWTDINYTEGTVPVAKDFDEYFEITVENSSPTVDNTLTIWMQNAHNCQYWLNGEKLNLNTEQEDIEILAGTHNRIIVKAKNLLNIVLTAGSSDLRIIYNTLPVSRLRRIDTNGFGSVSSEYFAELLRHAKALTRFYMVGSIDARNTDMLLKELVECALAFGNLNHVTILGTAPSAAGLIDKAELISLGVTTTTS